MISNTPSEQALLAEYQACQDEAGGASSWSWQSGIVFFVTTLTLAGTIIYGLLNTSSSPYRLTLIIILGIFSIVLLYVWIRYLTRQHLIRRVMFYRMEEIERELGLRKGLYVSFLDETLKDNPLDKNEKNRLLEKFGKTKGRKPQGFKLTRWVALLAIIAWVILILIEILIYFSPIVRGWLFN